MSTSGISDAVLCGLIAKAIPAGRAKVPVTPAANLRNDLAIDSIGLISMMFFIEEHLGLALDEVATELRRAERVSDIIRVVQTCAGKHA